MTYCEHHVSEGYCLDCLQARVAELEAALVTVLDTHDAWDAAEDEKWSPESMSRRMVRCQAFYGAKNEARALLAPPAVPGGGR